MTAITITLIVCVTIIAVVTVINKGITDRARIFCINRKEISNNSLWNMLFGKKEDTDV